MPPKRKVPFDPEVAKAHAKKIKDAIHKIQESAKAFFGVMEMYESAIISPCDYDGTVFGCQVRCKWDLLYKSSK